MYILIANKRTRLQAPQVSVSVLLCLAIEAPYMKLYDEVIVESVFI